MRKFLTITLFLSFFNVVFSQSKSVLKGSITYLDTPITNVHIHNLTTNFGEISDGNGHFEISVRKNDTLKVSHLEYQSKKIIITDEILQNKNFSIELKIMTNYLNTVILKKHNLSGILLTDAKDYTNDTISKKHSLIEEMMRLAKMPSNNDYISNLEQPIMNNVNPIGDGMSIASVGIPIKDKANILRKKLREKKNFPDKLIKLFGKDYFINDLKIPEEKIYNFITYCELINIQESLKQNKIMKLIDILTEESIKYHNTKE